MIAPERPRAEQNKREPKKTLTGFASGSGVSKMRVPTQPRMMMKPSSAPAKAPTTTAVRFLTSLIQYARMSDIGRASKKPQKSPMKMPSMGTFNAGMNWDRSIVV
jgi:hypothetical protein